MLNLLTEVLIRYRQSGGTLSAASLSQVYAALMADEVQVFPALRPHQSATPGTLLSSSWVQWQCTGLAWTGRQPRSEEWRSLIRALTSGLA